ncbi:uncharacterized protein LOC132258307 [Phlebotomus argentipes]|uniref:uncharacterized protein LOC132258307 n=1 Tax=Phlebotomus argentipes TaxID=94469 RepID=UPI0028934F19|nr:uncharacterized protein LOC132258307 [Phlebotomus argentipes]
MEVIEEILLILFICFIAVSFVVGCLLCWTSGKWLECIQDSEVSTRSTRPLLADTVNSSSSHTSHTSLGQSNSGESHSFSARSTSRQVSRPIGFTEEVVGSLQHNTVWRPNPPYPLDNLMPVPMSPAASLDTQSFPSGTCTSDTEPPSYEHVMNNQIHWSSRN